MIYLDLFWIFFRMSLISFGGVFGLLPEMQEIIVDHRHWMSADQFVQSYVVAQFVPGPNMAMCSLIGYRVAGLPGAIAASAGIYLGPILIMAIGCTLYFRNREKQWVRRTEIALRPLVFALILSSSAVFLRQQLGAHWILGGLIGAPFVWLDWKRRISPMSCIFLVGMIWLASIELTNAL